MKLLRSLIPYLLLTICLAIVTTGQQSNGSGKAVTQQPVPTLLEGYVFDSARRPIAGVDVSVWVVGKNGSVTGGKTDKVGRYSLKAPASDSFDMMFMMSRYHTAVVNHLAEKKDQKISKILYRWGENVPVAAGHEILQSMDRVFFLALNLPAKERQGFLKQFQDPDGDDQFGIQRLAFEPSTPDQKPVIELLNSRRTELLKQAGKLHFKE